MTQQHRLKNNHFYLIFPNIFEFKGGVQVYSAFLLKSLQELYPDANYDIFIKYDKNDSKNLQNLQFLPQTKFHYFGHFPRLLQTILLAITIIVQGIWQRPSLVISTHINYAIACYILQRINGVPYWFIAHGTEVWSTQIKSHKLVLQGAEKVIAVSEYTRERLIKEQNIDTDKIHILFNTFDAKQFQIKSKPTYLLQRYNITPNQPIILTVARLGRMAKHKGYDQILHALVKIRQHIPNVHYILAGKGDDRPRIQTLITSLNLDDCVTLPGFLTDEELCDHYNLCDVFAMPSQGEGFGIVFLEALACGKPVLAGNQDGSVQPLVSGELGCLVDPNDVEDIATKLIEILQGHYGNKMVYNPEGLRKRTIELFELNQFKTTLAALLSSNLK
ncbi:MAG: glycosyltransferase family 4 protein [Coleofasciculus sp. G1-WW12-02]|uniref:glycosyltransferase family 4 protein n=1 Tax=Coleofasciculus sp. G1-WW12-02 TaxID=3068483 RepID=UPI0032FE6D52